MVSRPATDRQTLDLQNAESATAWIVFCGEISRREENGQDQHQWYLQDLQVTNFFLSLCGQDATINLRSLTSHRNLMDNPYKDIRLAIQN